MIPWGNLYSIAGAVGFTPLQVREMSLWEFRFSVKGWRDFNCADEESVSAPSVEEFRDFMKREGGTIP